MKKQERDLIRRKFHLNNELWEKLYADYAGTNKSKQTVLMREKVLANTGTYGMKFGKMTTV